MHSVHHKISIELQLVPTPESMIMDFTFNYLQLFYLGVKLAAPILVFTLLLIIGLGIIVGLRESWGRYDSIYWAFITATTVGYGDIRPLKSVSKALSILIALIGMIFSGLLVALAINAATKALGNQDQLIALKACIEAMN
jgi:voltage-gated potassium channel